jgi:hypothetical protein
MILDRQNPVNPLHLGLSAETSGWKISTPVIHRCVDAFVWILVSHIHSISKTGPKVLHNISFTISSGERIGVGKHHLISVTLISINHVVVGRTGSGKVCRWSFWPVHLLTIFSEFINPCLAALHSDWGHSLLRWYPNKSAQSRRLTI